MMHQRVTIKLPTSCAGPPGRKNETPAAPASANRGNSKPTFNKRFSTTGGPVGSLREPAAVGRMNRANLRRAGKDAAAPRKPLKPVTVGPRRPFGSASLAAICGMRGRFWTARTGFYRASSPARRFR